MYAVRDTRIDIQLADEIARAELLMNQGAIRRLSVVVRGGPPPSSGRSGTTALRGTPPDRPAAPEARRHIQHGRDLLLVM